MELLWGLLAVAMLMALLWWWSAFFRALTPLALAWILMLAILASTQLLRGIAWLFSKVANARRAP